MSPQRKRDLAALIGVLAAAATLIGSANAFASNTFVTTRRYDVDRTRDSAWKAEQRAISLETLCTVKRTDWRCR